jgi:hypothetical protein
MIEPHPGNLFPTNNIIGHRTLCLQLDTQELAIQYAKVEVTK